MSNKTLGRGLSAFLDMNAQEEADDFEKRISRMEERRAKQRQEQKGQKEQEEGQKTDDGKEGKNKEPDKEPDDEVHSKSEVVLIKVSDIVPNPYQPRKKFDEEALQSLAESIKRKGVLQPVLLVKISDGSDGASSSSGYQLVAGERRFRATKIAGLTEIPAIITEMDRRDQLEIAILENIQREDLNPIEEAEAYKRLMNEFSYTQEQLSEVLGKSRSHIANILRLLNLPDDVKDMLQDRSLSFGHARALVGAENASELAKRIVEKGMSVRETEELLKSLKDVKKMMNSAGDRNSEGAELGGVVLQEPQDAAAVPSPIASFTDSLPTSAYIDPELLNIANQISSMLGLQVSIKLKSKSGAARSGTVEIFFKDFGDLDKLLGKLHG